MLSNTLRSLAAATLLTAAASAQLLCTDNQYPVRFVNGNGAVVPTTVDPLGQTLSLFATETVYLAFDPQLPSGTYYVHVTDTPIDGFDEVVSLNDPMDRFVRVTNNAGVITLSLPFSSNAPVVGVGLGGVGQSLALQPFRRSVYSGCSFKAWYGDNWDLTNGPDNPYLLAGGIHPVTGNCAVRSYSSFRIGDGTGSDVLGTVFADTDRDGVRDPGEGPLANWGVTLTTGETTLSATTNANGAYRFADVPAGSYTVDLVLKPNYVATTAASFPIQVCQCGDVQVQRFGAATSMLPCRAKPPCFWASCHGRYHIEHCGILPTLPLLCLVNTCGNRVAPGNCSAFRMHLLCGNSWNMAYSMSCELIAMHCNVASGFVRPECVIHDPCLGTMTIAQLLQGAASSLGAHPYTPPCSQYRESQSRWKNALARANNNQIWQ